MVASFIPRTWRPPNCTAHASRMRVTCSAAAQAAHSSGSRRASGGTPAAGPTIRSATLGDLDAVLELEAAARGSESWSRAAVAKELSFERGLVLVAELDSGRGSSEGDGAAAGTAAPDVAAAATGAAATGGRQLVGWLAAWQVPPDEAQVMMVAVRPSCRRRRIARRLLDALLLHAASAGARRFLLEVKAGNVAAQALYAGAGFQAVGRRRRYYSDGEDAVLMNLELDDEAAAALAAGSCAC